MAALFEPRARKFGKVCYFRTPGHHVIALPGCSVPPEALVPENWFGHKPNAGNAREVLKVSMLSNGPIRDNSGRETFLFVKSPERAFQPPSERGVVHDKNGFTLPSDSPLVENQAKWEARVLLGLLARGIPAEEPQAVITDVKTGRRVVVTKFVGISKGTDAASKALSSKARDAGAVPVDASYRNVLGNARGVSHVIDANRWKWPPFTNAYRARLMRAIEREYLRIRGWKQHGWHR
ncbi:MAG: hypothetical protein AABW54_00245 [Candidatus Micrarchaeota archaeon]